MPLTLLRSGYNLFNVIRDLDLFSSDALSSGHWSALIPFVVGGIALWFTIRSLLNTFRVATRLIGGLLRYGSLFALLAGIVSWVLNGAKTDQLANVFSSGIGAAAGGAGQAGAGLTGQMFGLARDYMNGGTPNVVESIFGSGASSSSSYGSSRSSGATNTQRKSSSNSARRSGSSSSNSNNNGEDLTEIAQSWVKSVLVKAAGLESWFGDEATTTGTGSSKTKKAHRNKRAGTGRTSGR